MTIRVVVIDDSALMRKLLSQIIDSAPDMRCVGTAPDPLVAREVIRSLNPDVLTLDVEMPRMDGLDFLSRLMRLRPTPVVMVSSFTEQGSETALRALELGAVDFVAKPRLDIAGTLQESATEITEKIRAAYRARVRMPRFQGTAEPAPVTASLGNRLVSTEKLIVVGASTGGTEALKEFLVAMPRDCPGILVTQHMPEAFTHSFANRLNGLCRISVKEAENGERVLTGHAYIAPGHSHLLVRRSGANYVTALDQSAPVNRHRPSVEVLFRSAAEHVGRNAIGVMMTGMGKDGAAAMLEMRQAGAYNFAQDEASCVVFGMPKEAIALGAVHEVVALGQLAQHVLARLATQGPLAVRV